jgi:acyl carrier protein
MYEILLANAYMSHLPIIRQFLHERLRIDPESVTAESTLAELKVDSLRMLDLMFDLEEKLDIVLTKDLPAVRTVGELDALLDKLVAMKKA